MKPLTHAYMHSVSMEDFAALSADELSEHLIEDKQFPVREVETLEGKPE